MVSDDGELTLTVVEVDGGCYVKTTNCVDHRAVKAVWRPNCHFTPTHGLYHPVRFTCTHYGAMEESSAGKEPLSK